MKKIWIYLFLYYTLQILYSQYGTGLGSRILGGPKDKEGLFLNSNIYS